MMYLAFALVAVFSYLVGSINCSIIISRRIDSDIRTKGSGNAGSTNMLRNYGTGVGVMTLAAEFLKAIIATVSTYVLFLNFYPEFTQLAVAVAGLFCDIGHCFPVFFNFKGGKGIAVGAMVILMVDYRSFIIVVLGFLIQAILFKYVSLASITGAFLFPTSLAFFTDYSDIKSVLTLVISAILAIFVIIMHRENIKRLIKGNENKLSFSKK